MKTTNRRRMEDVTTSVRLVITAVVVCCQQFANADPVAPCMKHGSSTTSLFVADTVDSCVFYWCIAGRWLQAEPFVCSDGTAVKHGYVGAANPCSADAPDVSRCQARARSTLAIATRPLATGPDAEHAVHRFPTDHHLATLKWKVIDLTADHRQPQKPRQQQAVKSAPRQNVNMGHRHFIAKAYVTRNVRIRGGEPVKFARSLQHCWKVCLSLVECSGFDYNASTPLNDSRCFLHGQRTICNPYEQTPGFDNYRLHVCERRNPTSTSTNTSTTRNNVSSMPHYVESIAKRHVAGGQLLARVRTAAACIARCVYQRRRRRSSSNRRVVTGRWRGVSREGRCVAVDFDTANDTCWLHSASTGCVGDSMMLTRNSSTHYLIRRHDCDHLKGYVVPGVHSAGGSYQPEIVDVMTCYRACVVSSQCVAIDFDSIDNSCWFHASSTTCRRVEAAPSTLQIRRRRDCRLPHSASSSSA